MAHDRNTLVLGSRELEIAQDELLVRETAATNGKRKTKASRSCGLGSRSAAKAADAPQSIPLYNILWAEVADGALMIDYAQDLSKTRLRAAKLSVPLPAMS